MTTALQILHQLREKCGGVKPFIEAIEYEGIPAYKSKWDSLVLSAQNGHIVRRHEHRIRSLATIHKVELPDDVFLTERQRAERQGTAA